MTTTLVVDPYKTPEVPFKTLLGHAFKDVKRVSNGGGDEIHFVFGNGSGYVMRHQQSCCEDVHIESIAGDLEDLEGAEIMQSEEAISSGKDEDDYGTRTFTFYKLATSKGYVTIRWVGSSNGYYSENVELYWVHP